MPTMTLAKEEALSILESGDYISNNLYDERRWVNSYELIFKYNDRIWRLYYDKGKTEIQDERPFEYDDKIECTEMMEVMIPGWAPKPAPVTVKRRI